MLLKWILKERTDEKIKEVDFIIVINGNKKQREEKLKELRKIADVFQIKLDVPRMRQMEGWQAFDITKNGFEDYHNYLPSLTLSASFPLTITHFNDETGYILGSDIHTALPTIFDLFIQLYQQYLIYFIKMQHDHQVI